VLRYQGRAHRKVKAQKTPEITFAGAKDPLNSSTLCPAYVPLLSTPYRRQTRRSLRMLMQLSLLRKWQLKVIAFQHLEQSFALLIDDIG
jgi:hypothetical protein